MALQWKSRRLLGAVCLIGSIGLGAPAASAAPPPGRLLASNCFQCHGTNGKGPGFERLAGMDANEIFSEMKSLQRESDLGNLMARHSHGYTDEQLRLLSSWLSTQH